MEHSDFSIGSTFWTWTGEWLCTDIGTRVVVCVQLTDEVRQDPRLLNGPPYSVAESVMDENDFGGCFPTLEARTADAED